MNFLLDTNVVSESIKEVPNSHVMAWLADVDDDRVFLSVVTLAEIKRGVDLMPPGRRRDRISHWLEVGLPERFEGRILGIDQRIAVEWGTLTARVKNLGGSLSSMDAFLAATADVNRLMLVTRNQKDFEKTESLQINPWERQE